MLAFRDGERSHNLTAMRRTWKLAKQHPLRNGISFLAIIGFALAFVFGSLPAASLPSSALTSSQVPNLGGSGQDIGHLLGDWSPTTGPNSEPAVAFGGVNGYMYTSEQVSLAGSRSQAVWFKTTASNFPLLTFNPSQGSGINSSPSGSMYGTPAYGLYVGQNGGLAYIAPGLLGSPLTTSTPVNNGKWNLVVATATSTGETLWLNGSEVASSTNQPSVNSSAVGYWMVGGGESAGLNQSVATSAYANADITNVADFPAALDSTQISNMYSATSEQSLLAVYEGLSPAQFWTFQGLGASVPDQVTSAPNPGTTPLWTPNSVIASNPLIFNGTQFVAASTGPINGGAYKFNGTNNAMITTTETQSAPTTFTQSIWFKTTTPGGLMTFSQSTGENGNTSHDRMIWIDNTGNIVAGVDNGPLSEIATSGTAYDNGQWHLLTVTLSSAGFYLYVDGSLAASNTSVTTAAIYSGYWYVGWAPDNIGWSDSSSAFFTGDITGAAIYHTALSASQVASIYSQSTFSNYSSSIMSYSPSEYWGMQPEDQVSETNVASLSPNSTNPSNPVASYGSHFFASTNGSLGGSAYSFNGTNDGLITVHQSSVLPQTFTQSLWFKTTTPGGLLSYNQYAGFNGSAAHDRMIWIDNAGNIVAGVDPGSSTELSTSGTAYDNGQWHFVTVTLSSAGFYLYVDGSLAASNTSVTSAQVYSGYTYIGWAPDNVGWSDSSPPFFTGDISGVAIYHSALSAAQISTLYSQSSFANYSSAVLADSPANYWPLQSGQSVLDNLTGHLQGDYSVANSQPFSGANAVQLSGQPGMMSTPTDVYTASGQISVGLAFNASAPGGLAYVSPPGGAPGQSMALYLNSAGQIEWYFNGATITSPNSYDNNKWYQVLATNGPSGMDLYVNGSLVAQNASVQYNAGYIGRWNFGALPTTPGFPSGPSDPVLDGGIAVPTVFAGQLSATQAASLYGSDTSATAYFQEAATLGAAHIWQFAGTPTQPSLPVYDLSTPSDPGYAVNAALTTGPLGGGALAFSSSGTHIDTTSPQTLPTTAYSVGAWANAQVSSGIVAFSSDQSYSTATPSSEGPAIWTDSAGNIVATYPSTSGTTQIASTGTNYNDGNWHFIDLSVSASGATLYVDGAAVATSTAPISSATTTGYWDLGWVPGSTSSDAPTSPELIGKLSNVFVADNAISASVSQQIAQSPTMNVAESYILSAGALHDWTTENTYTPEFFDSGSAHNTEFTNGTITVSALGGPMTGTNYVNMGASTGGVYTDQQASASTDFTIGGWINTTQANIPVFGLNTNSNAYSTSVGPFLSINSSGDLTGGMNGTVLTTSSSSVNTGQWEFVALQESGTTMTMTVNGTATTASNSTSPTGPGLWATGLQNSSYADFFVLPSSASNLSTIAGSTSQASYQSAVMSDSPSEFWPISTISMPPTTPSKYTPYTVPSLVSNNPLHVYGGKVSTTGGYDNGPYWSSGGNESYLVDSQYLQTGHGFGISIAFNTASTSNVQLFDLLNSSAWTGAFLNTSGQLTVSDNQGASISTSASYNNGQWNNTYIWFGANGDLLIYVDGVLVSKNGGFPLPDAGSMLYVGANGGGAIPPSGDYAPAGTEIGQIATFANNSSTQELTLLNTSMSSTQYQNTMISAEPNAYWSLNNPDSEIVDMSSNRNPIKAPVSDMVSSTSSPFSGGSSMQLMSGSATASSENIGSTLGYSGYFNITTPGDIFSLGNNVLSLNSSDELSFTNGTATITSSTATPLNSWQILSVEVSPTGTTLYDGATAVATSSSITSVETGSYAPTIGGGGFTGYAGDSVLGAPLSASQVASAAGSTTANAMITNLVLQPDATTLNIWRMSQSGIADNIMYSNTNNASSISDPSISYTTNNGPQSVSATVLPVGVQSPTYSYTTASSNQSFSYGVWFNTQDPSNSVSLAYFPGVENSYTQQFTYIIMNPSGDLSLNTVSGSGSGNSTSSTQITEPSSGPNYGNDQWHYLLLVDNSATQTLKMYVDGSLLGQTSSSNISVISNTVYISLDTLLLSRFGPPASLVTPTSMSYGPSAWFNYPLDTSEATALSAQTSASSVGSLPLTYGASQFYGFLPATSSSSPPSLGGVNPAYLPTSGGTVKVFGSDLSSATFTVGGTAVTPSTLSNNSATLAIPTSSAGENPVVATTANGSSTVNIDMIAPPTITSVSPLFVPISSGGQITITGTNLDPSSPSTIPVSVSNNGGTAGITLGIISRTNTQVVLSTSPVYDASTGTINIDYTLTGLGSATNDTVQAVSAPVISSISPSNNLLANTTGTVVSINGQSLTGSTITINGVNVPVTSNTGTVLSFTAPSEPNGTSYPMVVTNADGSVTQTLNWYSTPTITSVTPSSVPEAGATVSIQGTNLVPTGSPIITLIPSSGTAINISDDLASGGSNTNVSINVPSEPTGQYTLSYDVPGVGTVTTPFAIYGSPSITAVSPSTVGDSTGDTVTLTGFFPGTPSITVDGVSATVSNVSSNLDSLTFDMPSGVADGSDESIVYSNNFGTANGSIDVVANPVITSLSPSSIPASGGQVIINGTGFLTNISTTVYVDSNILINPSSITSTAITVQIPSLPAGPYTVNVGQSDIGMTNTLDFTVVQPPTVSSIKPTAYGLNTTPTVTIDGSGFTGATVTLNGASVTTTTDTSSSLSFVAPSEPSPTNLSGVITTAYGTADFTLNAVDAPSFNGAESPSGLSLSGGSITLDGTGLGYPGTISVSPSMSTSPTIVSQTSTALTLQFPSVSSAGNYSVTFTETGIGSTSTPDTVSYVASPTITSITSVVQGGSSSQITVTGTNLDVSGGLTLVAQPVVSPTDLTPTGSAITIGIPSQNITQTTNGVSFYANLPAGYYTLGIDTVGGQAVASQTTTAYGGKISATVNYGNFNLDLSAGPLAVGNTVSATATGQVGTSITAPLPKATWTNETGSGTAWQAEVAASALSYTGQWSGSNSSGLASTNAGQYVGNNDGVTYTVNVTGVSGTTVSFNYSSNYGTSGSSSATVGTATGVGPNGLTIEFTSSAASGNVYTVDAGSMPSGAIILNPAKFLIQAASSSTVSPAPQAMTSLVALAPGLKGAFGSAITMAQSASGLGMGQYDITPAATFDIGKSAWAANYIANIQYTIASGPVAS